MPFQKNKFHQLRWVNPNSIKYATPPSPYTDLNQFDGNILHPHASINRGYFFEKKAGTVLNGDWDLNPVLFHDLLEFKSIKSIVNHGQKWKESQFVRRVLTYIEKGHTSRGFDTVDAFIKGREGQFNELLSNIEINGVREHNDILDNIGVNIDRNGDMLFNNRGTHRLCISKALKIKKIPVLVIVWHQEWVSKNGYYLKSEI